MSFRTSVGMRVASCLGIALVLSLCGAASADDTPAQPGDRTGAAVPSVEELAIPSEPPKPEEAESGTREAICLMVESAARANDLPLEFFARVIWQESRFQSDAVGPITRSGERAQGIAQFMPGTASERRLLDPFDPVQALPKSAEFLSELRNQFGNLGLAAAAYNAGPHRVDEWLPQNGDPRVGPVDMVDWIELIPFNETRNYVQRVLENVVVYRARRGENTPTLLAQWTK